MTKILIIDDDPTIQIVLRRILAPDGYTILVASTGKEGVELAQMHIPALIICDWKMPEMNGLDVCNLVKSNPKLSPTFFILLTGEEPNEENIVKGLDAGCDDFLAKKIVLVKYHELKAKIRAGLRVYYLHQDLQREKQHLEAELEEAAEYVSSLLPEPLSAEKISIEARFIPSRQLGGDSFDYYWLDRDNLVIYLMDVSGHGLKAAFPTISVRNILRTKGLNQVNFHRPREVLAALNRTFPMTYRNEQYFTIWYGVYNRRRNRLVYASAGHPPAILICRNSSGDVQEQRLTTKSFPIGMFEDVEYPDKSCTICSNCRLYVFSDGIYEIEKAGNCVWEMEEFVNLLKTSAFNCSNLEQIIEQVRKVNATQDFADDVSIMKIDFN